MHDRVADHYGVPSINLNALVQRVPPVARAHMFRDDCHHTEAGAAFVAAAICAALEQIVVPTAAPGDAHCSPSPTDKQLDGGYGRTMWLPAPLHARPWGRGRAEEVHTTLG